MGGGDIAGSNGDIKIINTVSYGSDMGLYNRSSRYDGNFSFWGVE